MNGLNDRLTNAEWVLEVYGRIVYRLVRAKLSGCPHADIEDVCQNVFLHFVQARPALRDEEHGKAWFVRCAVNCCTDYFRSRKRRSDNETDLIEDVPCALPDYAGGAEALLSSLPQKLREVVYLYYIEGYATHEIAKMLGITGAGARMRLSRARNILRATLEKERLTYETEAKKRNG